MGEELRYEHRMSDADALMWTIEKDPLLRSTITAVSLLDGTPDPTRVVDKLGHASKVVPRLRQRVVGNPYSLAPPRWEFDPHFDLGYHVRTVRAPGQAASTMSSSWRNGSGCRASTALGRCGSSSSWRVSTAAAP